MADDSVISLVPKTEDGQRIRVEVSYDNCPESNVIYIADFCGPSADMPGMFTIGDNGEDGDLNLIRLDAVRSIEIKVCRKK